MEQNKKSSTLFWPGTEAKIHNIQPSDWLNYDHGMSSNSRVDQLVKWLSRPDETRADFATLYFSEVDSAGHSYGPNSTQVNQAISNVDQALGKLIEQLKAIKVFDKTTLIIVSDHGMIRSSE
jgi:predicted AlkP superfamily pyrophosphatase or phosphodiesterase